MRSLSSPIRCCARVGRSRRWSSRDLPPTSWTALLDARRLTPSDDATEVTATQLRTLIEKLIEAGRRREGEQPMLIVAVASYDVVRLACLDVEYLRTSRDPDPVWSWCSYPDADDTLVTVCWSVYLSRFHLEDTFRFLKQTLGRTAPTPWRQMAERLATDAGRTVYRRRGALVEPGFAQMFRRFGRYFNYRGNQNVDTEIKLIGAVHGLDKLFRHRAGASRILPAVRHRQDRQTCHHPRTAPRDDRLRACLRWMVVDLRHELRSVTYDMIRTWAPNDLRQVAQPLIPVPAKRPQGGGKRRADDRAVLAATVYLVQAG